MRDLNIPPIENPERFFPDPTMVRPLEYRMLDDGTAELFHPVAKKWRPLHPIFVHVMQGLEAGLSFDAMVAKLPLYPELHIGAKQAAKLARKFCWSLSEVGSVTFDLEPAPDLFHGRYRRIKELGRGGLGVAHLCEDLQQDNMQVVVKHPWGIKSPIESGQKALAVEIAVMQDVQHPSIPTLHDHFAVRGLLHMVRDFVDGTALGSRTVRAQMQDPERRNELMSQVCGSLHAIHEAGYLFFDPSPDNFYLVDGQVVTTDLGGCRAHVGGRCKVRGARGTPGYIAREMRDSKHPQARWASIQSDIWSVGCVFYHYIVGRRPKRAWYHDEIMASMDELDVRPEDRDIVDVCTHDDPHERPESMAALQKLFGA